LDRELGLIMVGHGYGGVAGLDITGCDFLGGEVTAGADLM
jgi:hypothetical protein